MPADLSTALTAGRRSRFANPPAMTDQAADLHAEILAAAMALEALIERAQHLRFPLVTLDVSDVAASDLSAMMLEPGDVIPIDGAVCVGVALTPDYFGPALINLELAVALTAKGLTA